MNEIFSMTNMSKLIELDGNKYILRIPGKGTDKLINRKQEHEVYRAIKDYKLSDEVLLFDDETGIKVTRFIENTRNCNSKNQDDVRLAMQTIKRLHNLNLTVDFKFDIKERIQFYESLMKKSKYNDYDNVKHEVLECLDEVSKTVLDSDLCLCHIDPNQDNILIDKASNKVKALIDWEYAAMQDPLVDVAMFVIYAGYDKKEIDETLKMYDKSASKKKYYTYIASCGLLWSNWCEYKNNLGQTFGGTYERSQYEYARQFSKLTKEIMK